MSQADPQIFDTLRVRLRPDLSRLLETPRRERLVSVDQPLQITS
jgi:hypothetical protein